MEIRRFISCPGKSGVMNYSSFILNCTICVNLLWCNLAFAESGVGRDWSGIVIHHSASPSWTTAKHIDAWHRERGFDEIGYHFVIRTDGEIQKGRSLNKHGAHALNPTPSRNRTHIGICLIGYESFSPRQYQSLAVLLRELSERFGQLRIEGHHEKCPGPGFKRKEVSHEWKSKLGRFIT